MKTDTIKRAVVVMSMGMGFSFAVLAVSVDEALAIKNAVVAKAARLNMSSTNVMASYTILNVETNVGSLEITAQNVEGSGTNGMFSYKLKDLSAPEMIVCLDEQTNGFYLYYQPNGSPSTYDESSFGRRTDYYVGFHNNGNIETFVQSSNFYFVGAAYGFNEAGVMTNAVFRQTPFLPTVVGPPPENGGN